MKNGISLLCALAATALPILAQSSTTVILGQPTDKSITANLRANVAVEVYFEYGTATTVYSNKTATAVAAADPNASGYFLSQAVMGGLQPDTQYYYRWQTRPAGTTGAFTPNKEYSFHTQRKPGSSFVFCVQGDSHPEREKQMFDPTLYTKTMTAVAAEHPDFYVTSGDDFSVDTLQTPYTSAAVTNRYALQLPYFDIMARGTPLFLGTGNHEETSLSNYNLPADKINSNQVPIWAQNARNLYYPVPAANDPNTGTFFTGNTTSLPGIGQLKDYYAWEWGDALFIVIDPYWGSPAEVDTGLGGQANTTPKTSDKWSITHGDTQYQWLKKTLETSKAKWKFAFAHHIMGTGRGGVEIAKQYEWGGNNADGSYGFTTNRPTWSMPIHQLLVANNATIFFQAHDHIYCHQSLDGLTYQSLPNPADNTYTAFNSDAYLSGEQFPNAGYLKVTVNPDQLKVEYIRQFLSADEKPPSLVSGMVQFAYTIPSSGTVTPPVTTPGPVITSIFNAASGAASIAPNSWVSIKGTNLAGTTRSWTSADFVKGQMPTKLDGVSVSVNNKAAYVAYVSPSQINILTPTDTPKSTVQIDVIYNTATSAKFGVREAAESEAFFVFNGGPNVAATHADYSLVGPTSLYPGVTTPAKPGEVVLIYGTGFGSAAALKPLPTVQIGGMDATVLYAGSSSPGQYQFNVTIPANAPDGNLPITASFNGSSTQAGTTIAVQK